MRKIAIYILVALTSQFVFAEQPPTVGLWEQLPTGYTGGTPTNSQRVDIVFVNRKIDEDTQFSALVDAGTKIAILCCVKVNKNALITLSGLLKKYSWDPDTADHLKEITGGKYVYEASVIDASERNTEMRELVKDLSIPPALSPYSAPVIAAKIPVAEIDKKFKVDHTDVVYSMRASQDKSVISYKFSINGSLVTLTEGNFPD